METHFQRQAMALLARQLRQLEKTAAPVPEWDKWAACATFAKELHLIDKDTYCGFLARYAMRLSSDGRP